MTHADRKIRNLMAGRRSIYNQVTELTNRIKEVLRASSMRSLGVDTEEDGERASLQRKVTCYTQL
ncbi:hypothetical protein SUDANB43_03373 [Streptomyces sp. enrichment culture]